MRIVFFGTPEFAVCSFTALVSAYDVRAVVTQPDKPRGRSDAKSFSPVKDAAIDAGVPVLQPESLGDAATYEKLKSFGADIFVVAAYGNKLPKRLLALPGRGAVNVHASLLPEYRGAAPVQRAIMDGADVTGVTIMQMDGGIDTGDIILQKEIEIAEAETGGGLVRRLAELGAGALAEALFLIERGEEKRVRQDGSRASRAPMITNETGSIDWTKNAAEIKNLIRALDPVPGAYTFLNGERLKLYSAAVTEDDHKNFINEDRSHLSVPGEIHIAKNGALLVGTGSAERIMIGEIQKDGGRRMDTAAFLRGRRMTGGERFE